MYPIISILISLVLLIAGLAIGYFFHRYQADIALKNQQDKAENVLKGASEQARLIESQARENAVKIVQDRQSGQPKGIAFVEMSTQWEGRRAVSMLNRQDFMGKNMLVKEATEKRGFGRR